MQQLCGVASAIFYPEVLISMDRLATYAHAKLASGCVCLCRACWEEKEWKEDERRSGGPALRAGFRWISRTGYNDRYLSESHLGPQSSKLRYLEHYFVTRQLLVRCYGMLEVETVGPERLLLVLLPRGRRHLLDPTSSKSHSSASSSLSSSMPI